MSSILLEHLDNSLVATISDLAKARNVSVEDQIAAMLREVVRRGNDSLLARADAIAAMTPKGIKQTDSTLLIREDRDR